MFSLAAPAWVEGFVVAPPGFVVGFAVGFVVLGSSKSWKMFVCGKVNSKKKRLKYLYLKNNHYRALIEDNQPDQEEKLNVDIDVKMVRGCFKNIFSGIKIWLLTITWIELEAQYLLIVSKGFHPIKVAKYKVIGRTEWGRTRFWVGYLLSNL